MRRPTKHPRYWLGVPILLSLAALGLVLPTVPERLAAQGGDLQVSTRSVATNARLGLCFVTSAESHADAERFGRAVTSGAQWDRFPLYWQNIETGSGSYDYSEQDKAIIADVNNGLRTLAILLGTPDVYATGGVFGAKMPDVGENVELLYASGSVSAKDYPVSAASSPPRSLDAPVFSDGTDIPGAGKSINPNNPWANFVYTTVNRYKPGGVLATEQGWASGTGILHWEIWNEADLPFFWSGSVQQYYRLLKVGYLAAKFADPRCAVLLGGLAYNDGGAWFGSLLSVMAADSNPSLRDANSQYFNILGLHAYSLSSDAITRPEHARALLAGYGLTKRIWITEMGVPVWDDYPGPTNDPYSLYRATMLEQAAYVIQAHAYAMYAGVEYMFWFQLHDDCGNGPTAKDAYGLFRNEPDAVCYPANATARPSFTAYQVAAEYFRDLAPLWRVTKDGAEVLAMRRSGTSQRVVVMWATGGSSVEVQVSAAAASGTLIDIYGNRRTVTPTNGVYTVSLPAATNRNLEQTHTVYMIGGLPTILVEDAIGYVSGELVANGGFENALAGWSLQGSTPPVLGSGCRTGTGCALLGQGFVPDPNVPGDEGTKGGNSTLVQHLSLDPIVENPTLRLNYRIANEESDKSKGWFEVIVIQTIGQTQIATYLVPSRTLYQTCGWTYRQFDLTQWRGQNIDIVFNVYQSSAEKPTLAWVDDVSISDLYQGTFLPSVRYQPK